LQGNVKPEITIKINNNNIFAGPMDFPNNSWDWRKYKVPRGHLKQGENIIIIENTTKDYKTGINAGNAGPAEKALAQDSNWGGCIVAAIKLAGLP